MEALLGLFFHGLFGLLWWGILLPILWLVSAPVILILAIFSKYPYWQEVGDMFSKVTDVWKELGTGILL